MNLSGFGSQPAKLTTLFLCVVLTNNAWAAPNADASDEVEKFLQERGILSRVEILRQRMGDKASDLVINAMGFLGVPYRRGGTSQENGFDCSTKFTVHNPDTQWYKTYLQRKEAKLLQIVKPLRSERRAYAAQLNKDNAKIEKEVLQVERKKRSTANLMNVFSEILKTLMGVW